ncbi:hypothetical protein CRUP_038651, partial [Coryphaenoides rupestris]
HIQDPASQRLTWNKPPKSVLVIKKIRDASLLQPFKELCLFLTEVKSMIVYVERKVLEDPAIAGDDAFQTTMKKFCTFTEGNVSIVLRSRLRVHVQKDGREKLAKVEENGIILTKGDGVRKAAQYQ